MINGMIKAKSILDRAAEREPGRALATRGAGGGYASGAAQTARLSPPAGRSEAGVVLASCASPQNAARRRRLGRDRRRAAHQAVAGDHAQELAGRRLVPADHAAGRQVEAGSPHPALRAGQRELHEAAAVLGDGPSHGSVEPVQLHDPPSRRDRRAGLGSEVTRGRPKQAEVEDVARSFNQAPQDQELPVTRPTVLAPRCAHTF
jgi:hypothetical protein